jgi:GT2 family glycosyltransferase
MKEKIGCAIITCDRPEMFKKCLDSIRDNPDLDEIVIINDGIGHTYHHSQKYPLIQHTPTKQGVAKSKNEAFLYLLGMGCDHIFLIEDDMIIKDDTVFDKYIKASKISGIQHLNFSQHGYANKFRDENSYILPNPKITIEYAGTGIAFYPHCVGSFSYYTKRCLEDVGLMDESYYNACEHVDHTYEIIKKGQHPPFWWFADIKNSWDYIGDDGWSIETSSICSTPNFSENVKKSDEVFFKKHGHLPIETKISSEEEFLKSVKQIKNKYGHNFSDLCV